MKTRIQNILARLERFERLERRAGGRKARAVRLLALLLAVVAVCGALGAYIGSTLASSLGYWAIKNHPYVEPDPPPSIFGPDLTAWSRFQDRPGYDTAFTAAHSRKYTGVTSPNHVYIGGNALVFFGYDKEAHMDYILTEEYTKFTSISFSLRPMDLSFHALSQSGFLFNGSVDEDPVTHKLLYSGYMIVLEAREDDLTGERCADLRLYYVEDASLDDEDAGTFADLGSRTLISTYAVGVTAADEHAWPTFIRVEMNPLTGQFQVFVNGELRTRNLKITNMGSAFGFFTSYIGHDCSALTAVAYSNLRIEAPWETRFANATVYFKDYQTKLDLADPQTLTGLVAGGYGGQTGQHYFIEPPGFTGYGLIEADQKNLESIPYFSLDAYNVTTLWYSKKAASYKEATHLSVQNNGTAKRPVDVEVGDQIAYSVHAGGDGAWHYGPWVINNPDQKVITMSSFPRTSDGKTHAEVNVGLTSSQKKQDILIGTSSTSIDGKMTVSSNYPLQIGEVSSSQGQSRIPNDGILVGFQAKATASPPQKFLDVGTDAIAYSPACGTSGMSGHTIADNNNMSNVATNATLIRSDERYIKVTYNQLRNDAGYLLDFLLGAWGNAKLNDYIYAIIECLNSKGDPITISVYRPTNLWSTNNNGNSINGTPIAVVMPNPDGSEYADAYDGNPYVYPKDGKISLTVMRMHNTRHDYNIYMGAGQLTVRQRDTILRITDYLPPGLEYVGGSSGQYEGNIVSKIKNPDGSTTIVWEFGVIPPEGYTIDFLTKVVDDGLFVNNAFVDYIEAHVPPALKDTWTNSTYHETGEQIAVIEHFLDYNDMVGSGKRTKLQNDRFIAMPPGGSYTTSLISLGDVVLEDASTYRYAGWRLKGDPGPIKREQPPDPTIEHVNDQDEIDLFFAKNPEITVEFRYILDETELKDTTTFPVTFGDPFFLPDSARETIAKSGAVYNYIAYAKTIDGTLQPIYYGNPDKPVYTGTTRDETIVVYFTTQNALTVRYVEYLNEANVLKNNDYFLIDPPPGNDFLITQSLMDPINVGGKFYIYEGYSYPDAYGNGVFAAGPPPQQDFIGIQDNMEVVLHFSTTYTITVKWHEDKPYFEGQSYDELLPVKTFTVRAGDPFNMTAQPQINCNGTAYSFTGQFKWTSDAGAALNVPVTPVPLIPAITGDYTIIFLYEPDPIIVKQPDTHSVTVMYREYNYTSHVLRADDYYDELPTGQSFRLPVPPGVPAIQGWTYRGYQIDNGQVIEGPPPLDPSAVISDLQGPRSITLLYVREGFALERFRELGDEDAILLPDRDAPITYTPGASVPYDTIYKDSSHIYVYEGYKIDGGPYIAGRPDLLQFPVTLAKNITYLYRNIAQYTVTEQFRLWGDTNEKLANDNPVIVPAGGDYARGSTPPAIIDLGGGKTYRYAGYMLNYDVPIPGDADARPFTNLKENGNVITYLYKPLVLNVRQILLSEIPGGQSPSAGYLRLANDGQDIPLQCGSGTMESFVDYTAYTIRINEDLEYVLTLLVPQSYVFVGHAASDENGNLTYLTDCVPPSEVRNGEIVLSFTDADEWWITLFLEPPENLPEDTSVSAATNVFGKVAG